MVRIESIHAQYPTGNCPVSLSKFFSFFSLQQWKGFRKKHLSKNSPHHSSIFITTNRYYFDRGCRSDVDYRSHLRRLSLFLLSNAKCFSMSFLYVIAHLLSRAIGKITRFRWESQRKQLTRKGERNGEEISRGKTSILPARLKGYRSTPGSKRDLALQLITPDSRKSRRGTSFLSLETEWEIRHENSMKGAR